MSNSTKIAYEINQMFLKLNYHSKYMMLHLKLISQNLTGKYKKKLNSPGPVDFPPGS